MSESEFFHHIKKSKRKKAIKFSIFAVLILALGIWIISDYILHVLTETVHYNVRFVLGTFLVLFASQMLYSIKSKSKIYEIETKNFSFTEILNEYSPFFNELKENYLYMIVQRKSYSHSYEIQILDLKYKVLLNVDCPGNEAKGVLTFGYQNRMKNKLIKSLKNMPSQA